MAKHTVSNERSREQSRVENLDPHPQLPAAIVRPRCREVPLSLPIVLRERHQSRTIKPSVTVIWYNLRDSCPRRRPLIAGPSDPSSEPAAAVAATAFLETSTAQASASSLAKCAADIMSRRYSFKAPGAADCQASNHNLEVDRIESRFHVPFAVCR